MQHVPLTAVEGGWAEVTWQAEGLRRCSACGVPQGWSAPPPSVTTMMPSASGALTPTSIVIVYGGAAGARTYAGFIDGGFAYDVRPRYKKATLKV